jgi:hypothetical protein
VTHIGDVNEHSADGHLEALNAGAIITVSFKNEKKLQLSVDDFLMCYPSKIKILPQPYLK